MIDFTEARLSTVLDGLIALVDTPPAVSRSLNLIVYAVAVPLDPPEDDPDAEPQFRQLMMANEKRGSLYDRVGGFACSDDGKLWTGIASDESLVQRLLTSEGRVDAQRLRKGMLHNDDFPRLARAAGILSTAPIWIDDTPGITLLGPAGARSGACSTASG